MYGGTIKQRDLTMSETTCPRCQTDLIEVGQLRKQLATVKRQLAESMSREEIKRRLDQVNQYRAHVDPNGTHMLTKDVIAALDLTTETE